MKRQALLLFAIVLVHGCRPASAGAGAAEASEPRKTAAFHAIDITGTLAVEARIAPTTSVEVRGDAGALADVSTDVVNGVLVLGTKHDAGHRKLRVIVTAPELGALAISGVGSLTATGLANARLDVEISGTGEMRLSGTTTALHLAVPGTGNLQAKDLVATTADVTVPGTASALLHATKTLDATVSGTASITAYGKPAVNKLVTGIASISTR